MFRLACLILVAVVGSTSAFAPSLTVVERQPPTRMTALHSSRVNYVCPDSYSMETQRQSLLDQFNALQQNNKNGHVVDAASSQEPSPVAVEAPPADPVTAVAPPPAVVTPPPAPTIEPSPQLPAPVFAPPVLPTFAPVAPVMAPVAAPPAPVVAQPVVAPAAPVAAPPATSTTATTTTTTTASFAPPQTLFAQRNDNLLQAAAAGKSRWGTMEVEKTRYETGLKQALAILDGETSSTTTSTTTPPTATTLFEQRNQQILEAAAAGKSRWGKLEVEKTKYETGLKQALGTLSVA